MMGSEFAWNRQGIVRKPVNREQRAVEIEAEGWTERSHGWRACHVCFIGKPLDHALSRSQIAHILNDEPVWEIA